MPLSEILERVPPDMPHPLRVNHVVRDWTIGESYEATIKFVLTEMDQSGMTLLVHQFTPTEGQEAKPQVMVVRPTVVPSPS